MKQIKSKIIPLPRKDIDTDLIIPAEFLTVTTRVGLGEHVFSRLRKMDADFPFNLEKYKGAEILVTRSNFGCGSSREHAAWALADWGIKVVIAPSFADIFFNNAMKNGILPIVMDEEIVETIFERESALGEYILEVDLPQQRVVFPGDEICEFDIDPYRKECLIEGMDDFDYLLANLPSIREFDAAHKEKIFFDLTNL